MIIKNLNTSNHTETSFVKNLYIESFPKNERRCVDKMMKLYNSGTSFSIFIIIENNQIVGFLTHWDLSEFIFAEHFSISPEFRNGGYGRKVMELYIEKMNKPILLEVELPANALAERRIEFYRRIGFKLWENIEYQQPAYEEDSDAVPMKLMSWGKLEVAKDFAKIKEKVYSVVYNC